MPVRYPNAKGKLYMPSNGTEGLMFEEQWCGSCVKLKTCRRMVNACAGITQTDWRYGDDGRPECKAWTDQHPARKAYRCRKTVDLFG
jgi:hypothetical protein